MKRDTSGSQEKRRLHLKAMHALGKVWSRGGPRAGRGIGSMLLGSHNGYREDRIGGRL